MEANAFSRCSPRSLDSSLELLGKDGNYHCRVVIDQNRIRASCAEVWKKEEEKIKASLEIAFPILSRSRFKKNAEKNPNSFQFKVVKLSGAHFKVIIDSKEFREVAEKYEKGLSNERLSASSPEIIRLQADYCISDPIDGRERQILLLSIVKKSRESDADKRVVIAAVNAIEILIRSRFSFSDEDLKGVKVPGATLDEGMFFRARLSEGDLSQASLRRVFLKEADLMNTKIEKSENGLRKKLAVTGVKGIACASQASLLATWGEEGIVIYNLSQDAEKIHWAIPVEEVGGEVSFGAFTQDGRWLVVNLERSITLILDVFNYSISCLLKIENSLNVSVSVGVELLAISSLGGEIVVSNLCSKEIIGVLAESERAQEIKFSKDGLYVAVVKEGDERDQTIIAVWSLKNAGAHKDPIYKLLISSARAHLCHINFSLDCSDELYICASLTDDFSSLIVQEFLIVNFVKSIVVREDKCNGSVISDFSLFDNTLMMMEERRVFERNNDGLKVVLLEIPDGQEIVTYIYSKERSQITYLSKSFWSSSFFLCRDDVQKKQKLLQIPLSSIGSFDFDGYSISWMDEGNLLLLVNDQGGVSVIDVAKMCEQSTEANSLFIYGTMVTKDNRFLAVWSFSHVNLFFLENGFFSRSIKLPFVYAQKVFLERSKRYSFELQSPCSVRKALSRILDIHELKADLDELSKEDLGDDFVCLATDGFGREESENNEVFQGVLFKGGGDLAWEEEVELGGNYVLNEEEVIDCCRSEDGSLLAVLSANQAGCFFEVNDHMTDESKEESEGNILRLWDVKNHKIITQIDGLPKSKDIEKHETVGISPDGKFLFVTEDQAMVTVWKVEEDGEEFKMRLLWKYPYQFSCEDALISTKASSEEEERVLAIFESYGAKRM